MSKVDGLIAFYNLQEWWFSSFTSDEREYIDSRYQPMGASPHTLTQGDIIDRRQPAPEFLNGLNTWFRDKKDSSIAERIHLKLKELGHRQPVFTAGYFNGRHFTTYVKDVENLKKVGKFQEAEELLINLITATESESIANSLGVAPWYYEELAKLYRKQKNYSKEVSVLERFAKQKHAPGVKPAKLLERLNKARDLK